MNPIEDYVAYLRRQIAFLTTEEDVDVRKKCRDCYIEAKQDYEEAMKQRPFHKFEMTKLEICIWCHVANGNKHKALKSLRKYKDKTAEYIEKIILNPDEYECTYDFEQGTIVLTNEENVRNACMIYRLKREFFEAIINQL